MADQQAPRQEAEPIQNQAIRLYLLEMALQHVGRQPALLGLGSNIVASAIRKERDLIVQRLRQLGEDAQRKIDQAA